MAEKSACCVYWLYDESCLDHETAGYIGITNDLERRIKDHSKRFNSFQSKVLFEGTREECLKIENELRPSPFIGWNTAEGGGIPPVFVSHTEETKKKIAKRLKGNKNGIGNRGRLGDNGWAGKKHSAEAVEKMHSSHSNVKLSEEHVRSISLGMIGQKKTLRHAANISIGLKGNKNALGKPKRRHTCPHCAKTGGGGAMFRFHFDNCRTISDG